MFESIPAALASANAIKNIVAGMQGFKNSAALAEAISAIQSQLIQANAEALQSQEKQAELLNKVTLLENELRSVKYWEEIQDSYKVYTFPETGHHVFANKAQQDQDEVYYFYCSKCYHNQTISLLQPYGSYELKCYECGSSVSHTKRPPRQKRRVTIR
jgi:hypothetical protein